MLEKNEKGIWAGEWLEEQIEQKNIAVTSDNQLIITTGVNTIANGDDLMDGNANWIRSLIRFQSLELFI